MLPHIGIVPKSSIGCALMGIGEVNEIHVYSSDYKRPRLVVSPAASLYAKLC